MLMITGYLFLMAYFAAFVVATCMIFSPFFAKLGGDINVSRSVAFGGQRRAALCRELTKTHEEVLRASLDELVAATAEGARGEIVLVVAGSTGASVGVEQVVDQVLTLADQGLRLKQAATQVAQTHGLRKNELYQAALAAREN